MYGILLGVIFLAGSWFNARDCEPIGIADLIFVVSGGGRQAICMPHPQWIKRLRGSRGAKWASNQRALINGKCRMHIIQSLNLGVV